VARVKLVGSSLAVLESAFAKGKDADRIYWDTEVAGFGLRFRRGGNRSWILQYKFHGSDRRLTLGPYPGLTAKVARALAQENLAGVWKGTDPQQAKRDAKAKAQAQITLRTVIDNFLADRQPELRPATLSEMQRYLLKDWKSLHGWPIAEIKLAHVANIIPQLKKAGPVSASRSRSCLSTCFRWAMGNGLVDHNPVIGTINPDTGAARDRVLSDSELAAIWKATSGDLDYNRIVRSLILTGARRTEIGGMRWSELDFENRVWTIPAARTKNGNVHALPLPHAFWNIVEGIERRPGIDILFGYSERGYRNWNRPKNILDKRLAISAWTHHNIRRTVATRMADIGIQPHIIEAVLNHVSGHKAGVAGVYNRSSYQREVKTALAIWADHVASIVGGGERKILQFPTEAG
jgi:integrase